MKHRKTLKQRAYEYTCRLPDSGIDSSKERDTACRCYVAGWKARSRAGAGPGLKDVLAAVETKWGYTATRVKAVRLVDAEAAIRDCFRKKG